jgi:hypothetical protein
MYRATGAGIEVIERVQSLISLNHDALLLLHTNLSALMLDFAAYCGGTLHTLMGR